LGLLGVIVMVGADAFKALSQSLGAHLTVLGATISYALTNVFGRRFAAAKINPLQIALGQVTPRPSYYCPYLLY